MDPQTGALRFRHLLEPVNTELSSRVADIARRLEALREGLLACFETPRTATRVAVGPQVQTLGTRRTPTRRERAESA